MRRRRRSLRAAQRATTASHRPRPAPPGTTARSRRGTGAQAVDHNSPEKRPPVQLTADEWEAYGFALDPRGEVLQPDGGLAFECHGASKSQERGRRIEEATRRGGRKHARPGPRAGGATTRSARGTRRLSVEIGKTVQLVEKPRRRLHRMPRRPSPPASAAGRRCATRSKPLANAPREDLAAPDVHRRRSRCRPGSPRAPARPTRLAPRAPRRRGPDDAAPRRSP